MAARALTAVVTEPEAVRPLEQITVKCSAPDRDLLLVEWLNAIIFEMDVRKMIFAKFNVEIDGVNLVGEIKGEAVNRVAHDPAVEIKGATLTELKVEEKDGRWLAQCVVDV